MAIVRENEKAFAEKLNASSSKDAAKAVKKAQSDLAKAKSRTAALDRIISKVYEDSVEGKITEERFQTMLEGYETEQTELNERAVELEKLIDETQTATDNIDKFIRLVRSYTQVETLTTEIAREFIEKIIIGEPQYTKSRNEKVQEVRIVFNYIGDVRETIKEE
jgi:hypothetical protein